MSLESIKKALRRPVFGSTSPKKRARERGVAMLLVITSIAILTAVAVDFQYNSSVDLQLAANARDELRAEYLARSAVNISRLVLVFQKQLDGQANLAGPMLEQLGLGGGGGGLNIRLWEIVPVDCGLLTMILGAAQPSAPPAPVYGENGEPVALPLFGDFPGGCNATIEDEESKLNVNRLNMPGLSSRPPMEQALAALADPRFEFVFDKTDAHGVKMTSQEVLIALHDWIDERDTQATLDVGGMTIEAFPDGFGDENRHYSSSYPHRYKAKNAPFDTLDELYQVDGVSDLFMAAFRDRLTVYPDKNKLLNINTNDTRQMVANIAAVTAIPNDPKLYDGITLPLILSEIALAKSFSFFGLSTTQFLQIIEKNGIAVKDEIKAGGAKNNKWISDKSETFTIKAMGQAGNVEKTVTAVVRHDNALGKVLYFRQE
ncbi:MAG TPA: general secretion pathway protein GspK [Myxococcales bacterium]|nr:general secretion pathway protein GspK [Myxococcales bacterium]